ncbi:hypothetical protein LTR37_011215 [Vermiconidia calcicola]|uniref:Uncharacterized protein n=1 Tax=Vermiconidia calcicola TaxID=1690605 RepID=A0ACC3N4B4_9PEZI|nr:hypothetical protein LTR37_011215 [Vermiconidia calcicola]
MEYIDFSAGLGPAEESGDHGLHQQQHYAQATSSSMHDPNKGSYYHTSIPHGTVCDVKPRLTKEQHDILEAHFQKQSKPNTNTKKGFAESLNVSLEKVNNWFQNRRAKSKQDAKKAAGALNLYQAHQQNFHSDTESSPFETSPQYSSMLQQWSAENQSADGLGISHMQQPQVSSQMEQQPFPEGATSSDQFDDLAWTSQHMCDIAQEMNRRTLTQETFDAIARNGGMLNGYEDFENFQHRFSGNQDIFNEVFPELSSQDYKQQDLNFPYPVGAPLSNSDSTVTSTVSDQPLEFPPSNMMQTSVAMSASSSEWSDSRSSSLAGPQPEATTPYGSGPQPHVTATSSQWQPGQSVPVDVDKLNEEFRQAAAQARPEPQVCEQPLAWPADEAYTRRVSSTSGLAHSMGNMGMHTPHPRQSAVFKSPVPPGDIAARRQRPRPAALGIASLRSQSYSSAAQPASPGAVQQQPQAHDTQNMQLRRIRSAVAMSGAVAHGRVMKSTTGSAQRSPLHWTFNDAMSSPSLVRQISHGNLAPPTPMSPHEFPRQDGMHRQQPTWQASGLVDRHPSISETDLEYGAPYQPSNSVPAQNFSSPPHTPMYYEQSFAPLRTNSDVTMENTPPQSAPAGQSCFPSNIFTTAPQSVQHSVHNTQMPMQQPTQAHAPFRNQQYGNMMMPDQKFHNSSVTFAPSQQANVTTGPPPGMPLQFANGVPVVNAEGNFKMSFPPQAQLMQQQSQQMHSPPQQHYPFMPVSGPSFTSYSTTQLPPQPKSELFVHEYNPPEAVKRAATPRRPVDTGPKEYTFTNAGPEHFEEKKLKKSNDSVSPASSSGAASSL